MPDISKITIIGSGGVGGYFGGKLANAGYDVTFVARGSHLAKMTSDGLTVKSVLGDFHIDSVKAVENIADAGPSDLIILGVKSWQVPEIAGQLKPLLKPETTILPLQNGIMAADQLCDTLGSKYVIGGLCRIFSKIDAPGIINHFGHTPSINFGELNGEISPRIEEIKAIFDKAGIKSSPSIGIRAELWKKLLFICTSGILAVTNSNYGDVRKHPETRWMLETLLTEIYTVAKASGINLEEGVVAKTMDFIDNFPPDMNCSLTRDVWEGRPSEIEYQNGSIVKIAEMLGIDVPVNKFVYYSILPQERRARS